MISLADGVHVAALIVCAVAAILLALDIAFLVADIVNRPTITTKWVYDGLPPGLESLPAEHKTGGHRASLAVVSLLALAGLCVYLFSRLGFVRLG